MPAAGCERIVWGLSHTSVNRLDQTSHSSLRTPHTCTHFSAADVAAATHRQALRHKCAAAEHHPSFLATRYTRSAASFPPQPLPPTH